MTEQKRTPVPHDPTVRIPPKGKIPLIMWQKSLLLSVVPQEPWVIRIGTKQYVDTGHHDYRMWLLVFMRSTTEAMQRMLTKELKKDDPDKAD